MTLDSWKNKGEYFDYNTHQIFNIDEGMGEVILLIHGFPTASWDWWRMWERLTANYRILTLDMIGFGFSSKPRKHPYSKHPTLNIIFAIFLGFFKMVKILDAVSTVPIITALIPKIKKTVPKNPEDKQTKNETTQ